MRVRSFDLVLVHKDLFPFGPLIFEKVLFRANSNIIYELDDAVFLRSTLGLRWHNQLRKTSKSDFFMKKSRAVITGNQYLAKYAKRHNSSVFVFPTVVDLARYDRMKFHMDRKPVIVGWAGTNTNLHQLALIRKPLEELKKRFPDMVFQIFCDASITIPGVNVIHRPWTLEDEITGLLDFDIGVMPLNDDPWTRGKCGFKLIQYMALGLPVVCSPVGVNRDIVSQGENGFLAKSDKDWETMLRSLIENVMLRKEIGIHARQTVERYFNIDMVSPDLINIINKYCPFGRNDCFQTDI